MRLSLKDFFLDCSCCNESIDKAIFLLSISPDSRKSLLISSWIPIYMSTTVTETQRGVPGSKRIRRFAPIRFNPHPPAFELNKNTNSAPSGSLNRSTNFCRLFTFIVPSSRRHPYLNPSTNNSREEYYFLVRHIFSNRSNV